MHRQYVSATFCSGARTVPAESSRRTGSRDGTSPLIRAHTSAQSRKVHSFIAMPADVNRAAARQRLLIRVASNGCYQNARAFSDFPTNRRKNRRSPSSLILIHRSFFASANLRKQGNATRQSRSRKRDGSFEVSSIDNSSRKRDAGLISGQVRSRTSTSRAANDQSYANLVFNANQSAYSNLSNNFVG